MDAAAEALADFRRSKDNFFASGRGPVRGAALEAFTGLSYYPPDEGLIFEVPLLRTAGDSVMLDTSTGEPRQMAEFATVSVPFSAGPESLTLYAQPGEDAPQSLFLPFRDAGSGGESYGAGRYLDVPVIELDGGEGVRLDFNLAYHPYCAYGDGWTCPLPPTQNWLKTAVRAGERLE